MSTQNVVSSDTTAGSSEAQESDLDDDDPDEETGLAVSSDLHKSSKNTRKSNHQNPSSTKDGRSKNQGVSRGESLGHGFIYSLVHTLRDIACHSYLNILLVFVPVGIATYLTHMKTPVVFTTNALAIIPLASLLTYATESIARDAGDTIGALVNITFSNAVEVIMLLALRHDQIRIVQASLLGSTLVNLLLVLGTAILAGAALHDHEQLHNRDEAQALACLLCVSVFSMIVPNAFHHSLDDEQSGTTAVLTFSRASALILISVYVLYIIYQLRRRKSHSTLPSISTQPTVAEFQQDVMGRDRYLPPPSIRFEDLERRGFSDNTVPENDDSFELDDLDFEAENYGTKANDSDAVNTKRRPHEVLDGPERQSNATIYARASRGREDSGSEDHRKRSISAARSASSYSRLFVGPQQSIEDFALAADLDMSSSKVGKIGSVILLITSSLLVAVCAEFLINTIDDMVKEAALTEAFIGLIILPIIGNCAEHVTAVTVAAKNKLDLAIGVAVGSAIQAGLVLTPLLVLVGWAMHKEMTMYFSLFETVCLVATVFLVNFLLLNGRTNFLEGSLLCACYVIIGVGAFLFPNSKADSSGSTL